MSDGTSQSTGGPVGHQGARVDIVQRRAVATSGWLGLVVLGGAIYGQVVAHGDGTAWFWLPFALSILVLTGLDVITPGQMLVVEFFGRYIGTVTGPGFWWVAPFHHHRRRISVRVRNFETAHLKVNDADMSAPANCQLVGNWRIVEADIWDRDYLDLCGPATITITGHGQGEIAFGALRAGLDIEYSRSSITAVRFSMG